MTYAGHTNNPHGRPVGSRNRRTNEIFEKLEARGDLDPADHLSSIVTDPTASKELRAQAANFLMPYKYSKRGTSVAPRYVEDAIPVPEFTSIQEAQNFLADIARRSGAGELELQCATDISNLVKNWILSITAQDEYQLKVTAQGGGSDTTIHITGGLPQLPGSNIIGMGGEPHTPHINGSNGHVIEHDQTRALDDSSVTSADRDEPDHNAP